MSSNIRFKALILDDIHPVFFRELKDYKLVFHRHFDWTYPEILQKIHLYDILVVNSKTNVDANLLDHASKLKVIARPGSGMENIDLAYAFKKGITCFNSPEGNANAVAEHALALLLTLSNRLHIALPEVKSKLWLRAENTSFELRNKTIGIIGFGHTGSAFAKLANAFGMEVLAYDKYRSDFNCDYVDKVDINEIYKRSDVISFHLPLTAETTSFFNKTTLKKIKKNTILINTSRGKVLDLLALKEGFASKKILAAALDVLPMEPLKAFIKAYPEQYKWLQQNQNIILTPHIAGWSHEAKFLMAKILAERLKKSLIFH
ncbi:MAG: hydroxyacid dehydrogenase [Chitinophagales bacterium]|nr:hydroxyacid dehydrogenase [Chitinophagales bacterium]